jgi:DNA-binding MarR family transcriptional regulator
MDQIPVARLLASTLRLAVDEMHERLALEGYADLRPVHGYVLNAAAGDDGITASALASLLGITKQAVAKVVRELVGLGYLERTRDDADARQRPLTLTARGRAALAASARIQTELEREWADAVGARRLTTTRSALEAVLDDARTRGRTVSLRPTW